MRNMQYQKLPVAGDTTGEPSPTPATAIPQPIMSTPTVHDVNSDTKASLQPMYAKAY